MLPRDRAVGTDIEDGVEERLTASLHVDLIDPDRDRDLCLARRRTQSVGSRSGDFDGVIEQLAVEIAKSLGVTRGDVPDPEGIAGDERLRKDDQPGASGRRLSNDRASLLDRRRSIDEDGRDLRDRNKKRER